ncbi:MAG: hypothetical protein IT174_04690 [Acidobacteria bacterium]|nr:hypothetical protein [Acidobacteriota bacterium]
MQNRMYAAGSTLLAAGILLVLSGCGATPGPVNSNTANRVNTNANISNANAANTNTARVATVPEAAEPNEYQATVKVSFQAIGPDKKSASPTLTAQVARSGADRRMVFTMPAGGRVVYLDKAGTNYLVLPDKKQYAELDRESLGFDVRQLMMPEQIVDRVKDVQGVERVGEEQYNGRDAIKYRYTALAKTGSRAGEVATDSFLLVDKATGLPLHTETVMQSESGNNVQGFTGVKVVTDISNIQTETTPDLFDQPTEFQKIESSQIRTQVDALFSAAASMITQMINRSQMGTPAGSPATSPTPVR